MTTRAAAIYARISNDKEGAGLGVERQVADCRALAERLGWTVVETYEDNDLSAYSGKPRPGYRAMLAALEDGRADAVIAWHTDRLHRHPRELEEYVTLGERLGVVTETVTAGSLDLSTASGRMVARMLGAAARGEVEHAVERMQSAKAQASSAGRFKGGPRPFGYEPDGMTIREPEADMIRRGVAALLAGESVNAVVRDWNATMPGPRGGAWTGKSVRDTLLRPRIAGLMQHDPVDPNRPRRRYEPRIVGDAQWPAIVDRRDWQALRSLLTDPTRRTSPGSERRWLLSGIARCGVDGCGEPVIAGTSASSTSGHHPGYRCRTRGHVTRRIDHADAYVALLVIERLSKPDAAEVFAPRDETDAADDERLADLRRRLDDLAGLFATGQVDSRQLATGTELLRAQVREVESRIAGRTRGTVLDGVLGVADVAAVWDSLPLSRQRAIVDALAEVRLLPARKGRVPGWKPGQPYFDPQSVEVTWKGDGS